MDLRIPDHHLVEDLTRDPEGKRRVFRTFHAGEACATRVVCAPLAPALEGLVRAMVLRGAGSAPGLDLDLVATLEGYRVRHQLGDVPWLPAVVQAGLAWPAAGGASQGFPFVTTRWVEGEPLDRLLPLPRARAEAVLREVLAILAGLHDRCVVFGDLKPQNVVLGPAGTRLIDLDTLRRVPAPHEPVLATHSTRSWSAPEQRAEQPLVWLASDLYSFGYLAGALLGPDPPPPWGEVLAACQRRRPEERPTAGAVLSWLDQPGARLGGWDGRPVGEATVRVLPGGEARPGPTLAPLPPAQEPRPAAAAPAPPPRARALPAILMSVGGGAVLLAALGVLGAAGLGWAWLRARARADANAAAAALLGDLKVQKTQRDYNNDDVLDGIVARAQATAEQAATDQTLGVLALATAWSHKWHWKEGSQAPWDPARYEADLSLVEAALAEGARPEALVARSLLAVGACRKAPDDAVRGAACEDAVTFADRALSAMPRGDDSDWLRVETQWIAVMAESSLGHRLKGKDAASARHTTSALQRCRAAWPLLPAAPVNDRELVEECLAVAGPNRAFTDYLVWVDWLCDQDVEERKTHDVSLTLRRLAVTAVDPACQQIAFTRDGAPRGVEPDGSMANLCAYVGLVALGCADRAEAGWHGCARFRQQFSLLRGLTLACDGHLRQPDVPWEAAEQAAAHPLRTECALP